MHSMVAQGQVRTRGAMGYGLKYLMWDLLNSLILVSGSSSMFAKSWFSPR